jgi:signal transduction histidine kinase
MMLSNIPAARSYLAAGILLSIILGVAIFSQLSFTRRLRLANRQLRRSAQELQAANASKDRFIAHISHELRTPIAGISSGAELLEMSLEDPELLEDAATIRRASTHLLEVVNNLLTLSRGQADRFRVRVEKVALPELVAEVCQPWLTVCSKKGIALDRQSRVPEGTQVMGDATALRQILQNLISNAVKFTLEGGVKVELTISDAHVRVTVSDTGKGIDPALLPGLFQQFSTLDQWETRDQHGAGLGLFLSQSLARAMETEIRVASEPGRGTAFSIDLPLVQPLTGTPA